ncbi:MAG: hypothetical protein KJO39_01105 [Bacteroidia bacterium]|nr:hypothetical protein [Bacteroidia bacterium]NNF30039.1 hypothetical protein [Flavobacteriaceae bacterium]NNJ81593.1 hypothetical protein [Flavobacteriaceae bacterium]NNK55014.1 hypothetical protein [Flavobacteriaceae bacterium]NNM09235.1 hypothetical protein [Flavobacteriaceae bacterium]
MKTNFRNSSLRFGLFAISASVMLLFSGCSQEEVQLPDNEGQNLTEETTETRASGPSASGQGTISLDVIPPVGEGFRHFSFHARVKKNGSVQGSGVLTYVGGQRNLQFDIDCLEVTGNLAVMTGVVTRDNQFPELEGRLCWFKVIDNGEGANADPDQMALFYTGTDPAVYTCTNNFEVPVYDIEGGNVQVRE